MNENQKEIFKRLIAGSILCIACVVAVYGILLYGANIQHHGNGINSIRNELKTISKAQQEEKRTIERTERAIANSTQSVKHSKRTNKELENIEREDTKIISESQSILKRIRERNKSEN